MAKRYVVQLMDHVTRNLIQTTGGTVMVTGQGTFVKVALQDSAGASASNPSTLTNGRMEFWTADSVSQVDLYGMGPGGDFFVVLGVDPSGPNEIFVDTGQMLQTARIPFSADDQTGDNTETDTGFDMPEDSLVLGAGSGIYVGILEATETIDFGILAGESGGDLNGFGITQSVAALGRVRGDLANGSLTMGALLVDDEDGAGALVPGGFVGDGTAESVSYTLTAGSVIAAGLLIFNYMKAPGSTGA